MHLLALSFGEGVFWMIFWFWLFSVGIGQLAKKVTENTEVKKAAKDGLINLLTRWMK